MDADLSFVTASTIKKAATRHTVRNNNDYLKLLHYKDMFVDKDLYANFTVNSR